MITKWGLIESGSVVSRMIRAFSNFYSSFTTTRLLKPWGWCTCRGTCRSPTFPCCHRPNQPTTFWYERSTDGNSNLL